MLHQVHFNFLHRPYHQQRLVLLPTISIQNKKTHGSTPFPYLHKKKAYIDRAMWESISLPAKTSVQAAQGWSQYRRSLGHNKRNHPLSPFDKVEAYRVDSEVRTLNENFNPPPLHMLESPVTNSEIQELSKTLPHDKSPDCDGMSNKYIKEVERIKKTQHPTGASV